MSRSLRIFLTIVAVAGVIRLAFSYYRAVELSKREAAEARAKAMAAPVKVDSNATVVAPANK